MTSESLLSAADVADARLSAAAPAMMAGLESAVTLLEGINRAFYVDGKRKALLPVMAQTKPLLDVLRATLALARPQA